MKLSLEYIYEELYDYIEYKCPQLDEVSRGKLAAYAISLFVMRESEMLRDRDDEWRAVLAKHTAKSDVFKEG